MTELIKNNDPAPSFFNGVDLANYSGMWCIEPIQFSQITARLQGMNLESHINANSHRSYEAGAVEYTRAGRDGSIAIVSMSGVMTKKGSSMSEDAATIRVKRGLMQAVNSEAITGIILRIDSPGGTVSGTADLAAMVKKVSAYKPVIAFAEDLCASAAMWVASQCDAIYANTETAQIGSIGTYASFLDLSEAYKNEGIKTVLIKAGEFKAGGIEGIEISDEQIAEWQKIINAVQAEFTGAIASGRKMPISQSESLATGLVYMAADAKSKNLIDGIMSLNDVIEMMDKKEPKVKRTTEMESASFGEIVKSCHGIKTEDASDAMFVADCQKKEMNIEDVQKAWASTLIDRASSTSEELASKATEISELEAKISELEASQTTDPKPTGVKSVGTKSQDGDSSDNDPKAEFNDAIQKKMASGMTRMNAVKAVNKANPGLRERVVEAANA